MSGWMCLTSLVHALKSDMLRFLCMSGLGQGVEGRGKEDPLGAEHKGKS